jgi:hemerythrin HHE cation binding domain-containing protein
MATLAEKPDFGRWEDHDELEKLFDQMVAEAKKADHSRLETAWAGFRRALLLHLQAEELLLFPDYSVEHPAEAAALNLDHTFFRTCLDDFEVNLGRRLMDSARVEAFLARLRVHARTEDRGLYAWARCQKRPL